MKRISLIIGFSFSLLFSIPTQATLIVTLSDDGTGGTLADFQGIGTIQDGVLGGFIFPTLGDYLNVEISQTFNFSVPIPFIVEPQINLQPNPLTLTQFNVLSPSSGKDFLSLAGSGAGAQTNTYNINAVVSVLGLQFSWLNPGTYIDSTGGSGITQLGSTFTLIVDSNQGTSTTSVPEPSTLVILCLGLFSLLLNWTHSRKFGGKKDADKVIT